MPRSQATAGLRVVFERLPPLSLGRLPPLCVGRHGRFQPLSLGRRGRFKPLSPGHHGRFQPLLIGRHGRFQLSRSAGGRGPKAGLPRSSGSGRASHSGTGRSAVRNVSNGLRACSARGLFCPISRASSARGSPALSLNGSIERPRPCSAATKLADVRARAVASTKAEADRFASNVAPIIREIQASGVSSHRGIARALDARGVATARGGEWTAVQVGSILRRGG